MPFEDRRKALMNGEQSFPRFGAQGTMSAASAPPPLPPPPATSMVHLETASATSTTTPTNVSPPPVDWEIDTLVKSSSNFDPVPRVSASLPPDVLLSEVRWHEEKGIPLIIEGWHERPNWNQTLFSMEGFVTGGSQGEFRYISTH
jgi:hypothetical protein